MVKQWRDTRARRAPHSRAYRIFTFLTTAGTSLLEKPRRSVQIGGPPEHRDWDGESFFPPVVAASCRISAFVTIDGGLTRPTRVGERVFCMAHTHIGHDAIVGDDCELAPGTVIGGHAELGRGVRCGLNVSVKPFVKVGDGARLGMGAVVLRDVPAGEVWAGNPARPIHSRPSPWWSGCESEGWEMVADHERGAWAAYLQ